ISTEVPEAASPEEQKEMEDKEGQKYFDSGDYNMAKAKMKNKQLPTAAPDKTKVTVTTFPLHRSILNGNYLLLLASWLAG
uniref:cAMP regulated phosphoprotein 19 n=1 Tax=Balaenoptera musculus TaxID=9771 RepID=A0A8C0CT47_BALMU